MHPENPSFYGQYPASFFGAPDPKLRTDLAPSTGSSLASAGTSDPAMNDTDFKGRRRTAAPTMGALEP